MGKESAKVGQGKAFKEGWIRKDKDTLRANVGTGRLLLYTHILIIIVQTDAIIDVSRDQLQMIQQTRGHPDPKVITDLRKRKLIAMQKVINFEFVKGPNFKVEFVKEETDLTADMLSRYAFCDCGAAEVQVADRFSGAWKTVQLKPYNFKSKGALTPSGALHPCTKIHHIQVGSSSYPANTSNCAVNKVRHEFRQIFFEMGFEEMPTNRYYSIDRLSIRR